jgi:hypothetical protein
LRRLEEWYHLQGVATLSYTAPFSVFFYMSNSSHMCKLAHAALDEVSRGQVMQVVRSCAFVSSAFV